MRVLKVFWFFKQICLIQNQRNGVESLFPGTVKFTVQRDFRRSLDWKQVKINVQFSLFIWLSQTNKDTSKAKTSKQLLSSSTSNQPTYRTLKPVYPKCWLILPVQIRSDTRNITSKRHEIKINIKRQIKCSWAWSLLSFISWPRVPRSRCASLRAKTSWKKF